MAGIYGFESTHRRRWCNKNRHATVRAVEFLCGMAGVAVGAAIVVMVLGRRPAAPTPPPVEFPLEEVTAEAERHVAILVAATEMLAKKIIAGERDDAAIRATKTTVAQVFGDDAEVMVQDGWLKALRRSRERPKDWPVYARTVLRKYPALYVAAMRVGGRKEAALVAVVVSRGSLDELTQL